MSHINDDGAFPLAGLALSANTLYGTTQGGGSFGKGTVFKVNTDGTGFSTLHCFDGKDGANPLAGVVLSGEGLYGTANGGGISNKGTVFKVNINGAGFTTLHSFSGSDGENPGGGLILSGDTLYGTTLNGGSSSLGTIFKLKTEGTDFKNLHNFTVGFGVFAPYGSPYTNSDGVKPEAGLFLSGSALYGTASLGGSLGWGTVYTINIDGSGFRTLHQFAGIPNDGAVPRARLILSGNTLYGTASSILGISAGFGTVFKVNTDGTSFETMHKFETIAPGSYPRINTEGLMPNSSLVLFGNNLYGTAIWGGNSGNGTLFSLSLKEK